MLFILDLLEYSVKGPCLFSKSSVLCVTIPLEVTSWSSHNFTLSLICNIVDPITKKRYSKDPRYIIHKVEEYVKNGGFGDTVYFGPEAEFFVFDSIRYDSGVNFGFY